MAEEILSERKRQLFCAELLRRYSVQISPDNELLPVLYLSYQAAYLTQRSSRQHSKRLDSFEKKLSSLSSLSPTPSLNFESHNSGSRSRHLIRFQNSREAFWFAFGLIGLPVICTTVLILVFKLLTSV